MNILLSFLLGGLLGWFLRHLRGRKELREFRRQRLRENAGGLAAMDRQQLVEARKSAESTPTSDELSAGELARLKDAAEELDLSRERIQSLSRGLAEAESEVRQARDNDIELRRLRSECQSLQQERDSAAGELAALKDGERADLTRVESLVSAVHPADHASPDSDRLAELERKLAERDRRIAELERRVQAMDVPRAAAAGQDASAAAGQHAPAAAGQDAAAAAGQHAAAAAGQDAAAAADESAARPEATPLEPLFEAPADRDDLKKISGIGPTMERRLNELGVTTYRQLAGFSAEDIMRVGAALKAFPGRIERDDWVGGARRQLQARDNETAGS